MASRAETMVRYPFLEEPDISRTSFSGPNPTGLVELGGHQFLKHFFEDKSKMTERMTKKYRQSVDAVRMIQTHRFNGQDDYRLAIRAFDDGKKHLVATQGNVNLDYLSVLVEKIKTRRLQDFHNQADEATQVVQSLELTPWIVLKRNHILQPTHTTEAIDVNKRWLAQIVGVEVVFGNDGELMPGAIIEDLNGQVGSVPPSLMQQGIVIKI